MSKSIVLVISFSILLILSGCWNAKELKDMAIVSAVGIDKKDDGELLVSFQVVNAGQVGTIQGGGIRDASSTIVYSSTGNTVFEAVRSAIKESPRKMYFPHMNLIVINEQFAKGNGVYPTLDFFERDHETRTNAEVMISKDVNAEKVLMIQAPMEKIPAAKITTQIEAIETALGETLQVDIDDAISDLTSEGKELILSGVTIEGNIEEGDKGENIQQSQPKATLEMRGLAMFKDGKLIRWLEGESAKGVSWILGRIKSTIDNVACDDVKEAIAIETIKVNSDVESTIKNGQPVIRVSIQQEGNIGEVTCAKDLSKPETIQEIERLLEEKIKSEVDSVIKIAQEEEADIFGFGSTLQRQHPQYWKEHEKNWPKMFANIDVDIQIDANIRRNGMIINSFHD